MAVASKTKRGMFPEVVRTASEYIQSEGMFNNPSAASIPLTK